MVFLGNCTPVSYTHLDVYKRQHKGRGLKYKSLQRTVDRRCLRPEDVSNDEKLSLNNNNYSSLAIL